MAQLLGRLSSRGRLSLACKRPRSSPSLQVQMLSSARHTQTATAPTQGSIQRPMVRLTQSKFNGQRGQRVGAHTPLRPGNVSPMRTVPHKIFKPEYADTGIVPKSDSTIYLHDESSIAPMREACQIARDVLDLACSLAEPGVSPDDIDGAVHQAIVDRGAYPSPLNYHGFPKSLCSSVNEVALHGIPDDRPLEDGDMASFDVSIYWKGFHGDNCGAVTVGTPDEGALKLMRACQEALDAAIAECRPGNCLTRIGHAIHAVADRHGYGTVREFAGHGVGPLLHMPPNVFHFRNNERMELLPGMVFTIEPIFTEGSPKLYTWPDQWAMVTRDGGRAVQYEHTILVTEDAPEILTVPSAAAAVRTAV